MWDSEVQSSLGKYMFVLSGMWCGQLRAVVRGSAADDGDDSAAYWPVTLLSTVIAALTDTDHPLSSGQNTFIILWLFFFSHSGMSAWGKKNIYRTCNLHVSLLKKRDVIDLQDDQNNKVSWFQVSGSYWGVDRSAASQSCGMKCGQEEGVTITLVPLLSFSCVFLSNSN